ncbi:hypothetical protein D3C72_1242600 [compost metagenome]
MHDLPDHIIGHRFDRCGIFTHTILQYQLGTAHNPVTVYRREAESHYSTLFDRTQLFRDDVEDFVNVFYFAPVLCRFQFDKAHGIRWTSTVAEDIETGNAGITFYRFYFDQHFIDLLGHFCSAVQTGTRWHAQAIGNETIILHRYKTTRCTGHEPYSHTSDQQHKTRAQPFLAGKEAYAPDVSAREIIKSGIECGKETLTKSHFLSAFCSMCIFQQQRT